MNYKAVKGKLGGVIFILILANNFLQGQSTASKGELSSTKLVNVQVMKAFPGKPPKVSLVFRAETLDGEPVWDLKKEDLMVTEDSARCDLLLLEPISKNKPISVGVVIDHSGSMSAGLFDFMDIINKILGRENKEEKDTLSPLDHAKQSAKTFVSSFDTKKDYFSITAFGSVVDLKIPLNQDTAATNRKIEAIKIDGGTALYDGMMEGMKQLRKAKGVKVLVAMTDGMENASKSTWQTVVNYSVKENIPIYIVGLGNVNKDSLSKMAFATKGQFFHTNKSSSLVDIYKKISKQIQSFYSVEYSSKTVRNGNFEEGVKLTFDINSIYLANDSTDPEVLVYLKKQESDMKIKKYTRIAIYASASLGVVSLFYVVRVRRRRAKVKKAAMEQGITK